MVIDNKQGKLQNRIQSTNEAKNPIDDVILKGSPRSKIAKDALEKQRLKREQALQTLSTRKVL